MHRINLDKVYWLTVVANRLCVTARWRLRVHITHVSTHAYKTMIWCLMEFVCHAQADEPDNFILLSVSVRRRSR
ncbi:hypothetical protein X777_15550 [Ooceraea biroi]|uniref:Uncharacterized protein n=1 Tax=Ooceraea biroi TaxID=2015173 RepID=A0A026VUE2_OOCBI|nr:hypothetical protein X777_15550 [Ooceraea biroi]